MQNADNWLVPDNIAIDWRNTCRQIVADPGLFARFRQLAPVQGIVENRSEAWLKAPWRGALALMPNLPSKLPIVAENDTLGSPNRTFIPVPGLTIAATTAFYAADMAALVGMFGPLDGMRIVEIGGGYGGLAAMITGCYRDVVYTIYDLPEANALQKKYLDTLGRKGIEYRGEIEKGGPFDLCLSVCALCELGPILKAKYADQVIQGTPRGFLGWNYPGETSFEAMGWFHEAAEVRAWVDASIAPMRSFWFYDDPRLRTLMEDSARYRFGWGARTDWTTGL